MFKGIVLAISACALWGLIFIVPQFMESFSSLEVALGRYACYGLISLFFFSQAVFQGKGRYAPSIWLKALSFSLIITLTYYTAMVLGLRWSTPPIAALISGIAPISISFYGNWVEREYQFKTLFLPSILIIVGLLVINAPHLQTEQGLADYLIGILCCFIALGIWSWYVVKNARFLKETPNLLPIEWSTLLGVATLFWVALVTSVLVLFFPDQIESHKYAALDLPLAQFLGGSLILGLICSWVGAWIWNKASLHLPIALAGQITIFETLFGLSYVYFLIGELPPLTDAAGMCILLGAVLYGIRGQNRQGKETLETVAYTIRGK